MSTVKGDLLVERRASAGLAINLPEWQALQVYNEKDLVVYQGEIYMRNSTNPGADSETTFVPEQFSLVKYQGASQSGAKPVAWGMKWNASDNTSPFVTRSNHTGTFTDLQDWDKNAVGDGHPVSFACKVGTNYAPPMCSETLRNGPPWTILADSGGGWEVYDFGLHAVMMLYKTTAGNANGQLWAQTWAAYQAASSSQSFVIGDRSDYSGTANDPSQEVVCIHMAYHPEMEFSTFQHSLVPRLTCGSATPTNYWDFTSCVARLG